MGRSTAAVPIPAIVPKPPSTSLPLPELILKMRHERLDNRFEYGLWKKSTTNIHLSLS